MIMVEILLRRDPKTRVLPKPGSRLVTIRRCRSRKASRGPRE
jgi:hypothetical protein